MTRGDHAGDHGCRRVIVHEPLNAPRYDFLNASCCPGRSFVDVLASLSGDFTQLAFLCIVGIERLDHFYATVRCSMHRNNIALRDLLNMLDAFAGRVVRFLSE